MLTQEQIAQIQEELSRYPHNRAVCIEALKIVQRERGWVSDEGIRDVAALLNMSPSEVDSVATFYNLIFRKPVGRHVILVCDSVSCWIMGYEQILSELKRQLGIDLGQTTADGRFTLLPMVCLGACDHAPALMIDEDLHRDLTPQDIGAIVEGYA
jgi:NADH-quinone oxidoreductase subunit E